MPSDLVDQMLNGSSNTNKWKNEIEMVTGMLCSTFRTREDFDKFPRDSDKVFYFQTPYGSWRVRPKWRDRHSPHPVHLHLNFYLPHEKGGNEVYDRFHSGESGTFSSGGKGVKEVRLALPFLVDAYKEIAPQLFSRLDAILAAAKE